MHVKELTVNVLRLAVTKEPRLEVESNVSIHQKTIQQEKLHNQICFKL